MTKQNAKTDTLLKGLLDLIEKELPEVNRQRIARAYEFAKRAHEGQFRMSGVPYLVHPVEAAKILVNLKADEETIIAGLLHDVPEDTNFTVSDVRKRFGKHVASLVEALTKLSKVHYKHSMGERQVQSLQKVFLETAEDVRVIVVKLADRLHNMSTIQYLRPDKQLRIAKETLEIYAPLANLFGIYQLRRQLEDLCFEVLQPEEFARIEAFVHDHERKRNHFIEETMGVLRKHLKKNKIESEMAGRPKHLYSIYQKMVRDQKELQDIYDYFAIRVIVEDVPDCYRAMGAIHEMFKPKPGRIKDYIALPKANGYQSLHTTVIGLRGKLTEIQIRTQNMHEQAEFGAAAHLLYKNQPLALVESGAEILKRYKDPSKFIESLQEDLLQDRIHVFSRSGEVVNLPEGATPIDYMYAVGLPTNTTTFRVLVNNRSYSLIGQLKSGDHVEIIYSKKTRKGPERWWLDHVKTSLAKQSIQEYYRQKSFKDKVEIGSRLLQKALDHENQGLIYNLPEDRLKRALMEFQVDAFKELLARIGEGELRADEVYRVMFPEILIRSPLNVAMALLKWLGRFFNVEVHESKYKIRILIEANDRMGLLRDIIGPFYDLGIPILKIKGMGFDVKHSYLSRSYVLGMGRMHKYVSRDYVDVAVENHEQLISLFDRLEKIPGVLRVQRIFRRKQVAFVLLSFFVGGFWVAHPFLIQYLRHSASASADWMMKLLIYAGLSALFLLMLWLKSMGDKTFPHFEETRLFWPLAFGMSFLAIVTLFVEDVVFGLELQIVWMLTYSFVIFLVVVTAYTSHTRRRREHLKEIGKSKRKGRRKLT